MSPPDLRWTPLIRWLSCPIFPGSADASQADIWTPPALQAPLCFWISGSDCDDIFGLVLRPSTLAPMTICSQEPHECLGVWATVPLARLLLRRSDLFPSASTRAQFRDWIDSYLVLDLADRDVASLVRLQPPPGRQVDILRHAPTSPMRYVRALLLAPQQRRSCVGAPSNILPSCFCGRSSCPPGLGMLAHQALRAFVDSSHPFG